MFSAFSFLQQEITHYLRLNAPRRDIEGMSRSKRSMYRRRYEWLDNTKAEFMA